VLALAPYCQVQPVSMSEKRVGCAAATPVIRPRHSATTGRHDRRVATGEKTEGDMILASDSAGPRGQARDCASCIQNVKSPDGGPRAAHACVGVLARLHSGQSPASASGGGILGWRETPP